MSRNRVQFQSQPLSSSTGPNSNFGSNYNNQQNRKNPFGKGYGHGQGHHGSSSYSNERRQPIPPSPVPVVADPRVKPRLSTCVTFQKETDGRNNFPNQKDFHDFCKQRDLFYQIKEIWTVKQSEPAPQNIPGNSAHGHNHDPAFYKIRTLFTLNSSPTNMSKLSSLFLSQCVLDSTFTNKVGGSGGGGPSTTAAESNVRRILQSNPEKLEMLMNRVAPPEAAVDFAQISDPMAFLKYFINFSAPYGFTQYLIDSAVMELLEAEQSIESAETEIKEILNLMKKTRLLSKMLGHLYFLAYKHEKPQTTSSLITQASLRTYQSPPLDLFKILQKSLEQNRIVFTLPWILEFLAQADPAAFYIPSYKPVLDLISCIYQAHLNREVIKAQNRMFLRLYIETLFQSQVDCFYKKKFDMFEYEVRVEGESIDSNEGIGSTLNPLYFEKLGEVNIEPCPPSPFPDRIVSSDIQRQLESQFFNIHPPSMKKTIDFISERIASNFVKKLRSTVLIDLKKEMAEELIFDVEAVNFCKLEITKLQDEFCLKSSRSMELLESEMSEEVSEICCKIIKAKAEGRINDWVNQHVTKDLFQPKQGKVVNAAITESVASENSLEPQSESKSEQGNLKQESEKLQVANNVKQNECSTPFAVLSDIHNLSQKLYSGFELKETDIDIISAMSNEKPWLLQSTITLAIEIATFQPKLLRKSNVKKFVDLWRQFWTKECRVLSPLNLKIVSKSKCNEETWKAIRLILKTLNGYGLMSKEDFEGLVKLDGSKVRNGM